VLAGIEDEAMEDEAGDRAAAVQAGA